MDNENPDISDTEVAPGGEGGENGEDGNGEFLGEIIESLPNNEGADEGKGVGAGVPGNEDCLDPDRRQFFRAALAAVVTLVLSGGSSESEQETNEHAGGKTTRQLINRLFAESPRISPPKGQYNGNKIQMWRDRYMGRDVRYSAALLKYRRRKGLRATTLDQSLKEGWRRLKNSGHLKMVYEKCLKHRVPFEVIFLALAESHWNGRARSIVGAGGYWQFMPKTARAYGLRVSRSNDERANPEKSTDAALRLLKDNYELTYAWEGRRPPDDICYTDSDRWAYAFWAYNRGPGKVRPYYKKFGGRATPYAQALAGNNPENANYVNKIFGIREALAEFERGRPAATE